MIGFFIIVHSAEKGTPIAVNANLITAFYPESTARKSYTIIDLSGDDEQVRCRESMELICEAFNEGITRTVSLLGDAMAAAKAGTKCPWCQKGGFN